MNEVEKTSKEQDVKYKTQEYHGLDKAVAESYMNEIEKTSKEQDVKYKTQESTALDKAVTEATADRSGVQAELDAVLEYMEKLKEMCIEKAEPYSERKARRESEIAGLKQAMEILEGEAVLIQ